MDQRKWKRSNPIFSIYFTLLYFNNYLIAWNLDRKIIIRSFRTKRYHYHFRCIVKNNQLSQRKLQDAHAIVLVRGYPVVGVFNCQDGEMGEKDGEREIYNNKDTTGQDQHFTRQVQPGRQVHLCGGGYLFIISTMLHLCFARSCITSQLDGQLCTRLKLEEMPTLSEAHLSDTPTTRDTDRCEYL